MSDYPPLDAHSNQQAADIVRLCLLTGARSGEVMSATWDPFDLDAANWIKPSSHTKQKRVHRVPLSAPARQLLVSLPHRAGHFFPSHGKTGHITTIKKSWAEISRVAELDGVRVHDLRHSYASLLASGGESLLLIGQLLGHTQPQTTARYSHLLDDPLRQATERVGAVVMGGKVASVSEVGR